MTAGSSFALGDTDGHNKPHNVLLKGPDLCDRRIYVIDPTSPQGQILCESLITNKNSGRTKSGPHRTTMPHNQTKILPITKYNNVPTLTTLRKTDTRYHYKILSAKIYPPKLGTSIWDQRTTAPADKPTETHRLTKQENSHWSTEHNSVVDPCYKNSWVLVLTSRGAQF